MVKKTLVILFITFSAMTGYAKPESQETFLKTSISNAIAYPLQQIIYTVKIYSRYPLVRVGMQPPSVDGKQLLQMGGVQQYQSTEAGVNYYVAKVDYLLFSKKSGQRVITPPIMNGLVKTGNDAYNSYNVRNVEATAESTTLNIQPIPAGFSGDVWLPTTKLTVTDDWSQDLAKVKVGESITRTVILHAIGVMDAQLPDLKFPDIRGMSIYPDKPESKVTVTENGVEATKVYKFAIVPTQSGTLKVSALKVPWWDTKHNRLQQAVIEGATLTVIGGAPVPVITSSEPISVKVPGVSHHSAMGLWLVEFIVLLSGWLVALWLWYRQSRPRERTENSQQQSNHAMWRQLKTACNNNQAHDAYQISLRLGRKIFPGCALLNLKELTQVINDQQFSSAVAEINRVNYHPNESICWDGKQFFTLCKAFLVPSKKKKTDNPDGLPILFK